MPGRAVLLFVRASALVVSLSFAVAAAAPAATSNAPDGGTFRATIGGQKVLLPSITFDNQIFVSMKGMSAALGGKVADSKREGDMTVTLGAHKLVFSADHPSFVTVDASTSSLSREVRAV